MLQAQVATDDSTADEFAVGDTTTDISEPRPRFESTRQSAEDIGLSMTVDEVQDPADSVGDASFELDMTLPMVTEISQPGPRAESTTALQSAEDGGNS